MSTVSIGSADHGLEVKLKLSDTLVIRLPENPTTGVRWQWDQPLGPIQLKHDSYETPSGAAVGAASVRVLEFHAIGPGHVNLLLRRQRSWESDSSAEAEYAVSIDVE